jgi:hypothetical protein
MGVLIGCGAVQRDARRPDRLGVLPRGGRVRAPRVGVACCMLFALHCMLRSFCREEAQTRRAARAVMCGMASQACVFTKSNYFDECHAPAAIAQKLRALPTPAGGTDLCAPPHCPLSAKASLMQRPALADKARRWPLKPGVGR